MPQSYWDQLERGPFTLRLRHVSGAMMWMMDEQDIVIDCSPEAAAMFNATPEQVIGTTPKGPYAPNDTVVKIKSIDAMYDQVRATGQPATITNWVNPIGDGWVKIILTTTRIGPSNLLHIMHDITGLDPRARWLKRIDLATQRLKLRGGNSISFDEFAVIYHLIRGRSHDEIAERLNISASTVRYRSGRVRDALECKNLTDMMATVASSGLVHLLTVDMDTDDPAMDERTLYRRSSDFPLD
jgi:PAS domain-containing protein